jgi:hypothetical protein
MKLTRLMLAFATLALAAASAATKFNITIRDPQWVNGNQLKPGEYSVQIDGDKAVIKSGKNVVEVPAKIETAPAKYSSTELFTQPIGGKSTIEEIRVGGTHTKVVFGTKGAGAAAAQ